MPPLFSITTNRVRLTWSGPTAPPDATAPPGVLAVRPLRTDAAPHVEANGMPVVAGAPLRLAEQTTYRLFAASPHGVVEIRHRDPVVVGGLAREDGGRVVAGTVNFGGQIGRSTFVIAVDGEEEVAFEVDVEPTKAAWADVEAMRDEVDEALAGLALDYLRATASPAVATSAPPRRATWLTLVRRALPTLEAALDHIAAHPRRDLLREPTLVRAERVQRPDASLRAAVRQGRGAGPVQALRSGVPVRARLTERLARATLDTSEHRWLRARTAAARRTLAELHADESRGPASARRRRVLADLADTEARLARLLRLAPLAAASPGPPPAPTPRLLTAPGYAEAHAACQSLTLGLRLADGPVPHATNDLWALYEVWAYLTVVRAVARVLDRPISPHDFFRAEHRGIRFLLRRGRRHGVAFEADGRRVTVTYNPRFPARAGLLAQRPDVLLTIERDGTTRRFVLDAKYRRDDSTGYARRHGAPGPPEPALGDLHRYRDAIVSAAGERTVEQAVALFPYREPAPGAFAASKLWTAVEAVGVGAIPLLPGATAYLDRWLRLVLG
ncbi:MAG: DUF2357 domain-containing protein [Rhodothermales bacterium]